MLFCLSLILVRREGRKEEREGKDGRKERKEEREGKERRKERKEGRKGRKD